MPHNIHVCRTALYYHDANGILNGLLTRKSLNIVRLVCHTDIWVACQGRQRSFMDFLPFNISIIKWKKLPVLLKV